MAVSDYSGTLHSYFQGWLAPLSLLVLDYGPSTQEWEN